MSRGSVSHALFRFRIASKQYYQRMVYAAYSMELFYGSLKEASLIFVRTVSFFKLFFQCGGMIRRKNAVRAIGWQFAGSSGSPLYLKTIGEIYTRLSREGTWETPPTSF